GDLNSSPQCRLAGSHRNREMNVVPFAAKHRMASGADDHVEIAGLAAAIAGISLPRNTDALAIAGSGLDANFERLAAADHPFPVAHRARGNILARPSTARARHVELHATTGLLDRSFALTLRADARLLNVSAAAAIAANILAGDVQPHHASADCRPERHVHLIFEIATRFRALLRRSSSATSPKNA